MLHDLRYACRTLWRSRTFTMTALTVLALGIGANTTIYTVVRGLAFRPLPFDDPERLVFVGELGPGGRREPVSPANFADVARETRAFEHLASHRGARFILTGAGLAESVIGANVSEFGVSATDPMAFAIGCMLLIVAATASYVPARRAANVDPLVALRHE